MALLHQAELRPSKLELLDTWACAQPWFDGDAEVNLTGVAAYRFDDPDGEVGIETLLVRGGEGPVLQVPLTYRNSQLAGADASLIGTLHHSVLGQRWVYDGLGDPVYLAAVATTIQTGGSQAELEIEVNGAMVRRDPTATVRGSGSGAEAVPTPPIDTVSVHHERGATVVDFGMLRLVIARVLGESGLAGELLTALAVADRIGTAGRVEDLRGRWAEETDTSTLVVCAGPAPE